MYASTVLCCCLAVVVAASICCTLADWCSTKEVIAATVPESKILVGEWHACWGSSVILVLINYKQSGFVDGSRNSLVVEQSLRKRKVGSSILPCGSLFNLFNLIEQNISDSRLFQAPDVLFHEVKFRFKLFFALADLHRFTRDVDWNPRILSLHLSHKSVT